VVDAVLEGGRATYPALSIERSDLAAFLTARPACWPVAGDRAADLYLACACVRGDPEAAAIFIRRYLERTAVYLGKLARDEELVAEVRQRLAITLLVGREGGAPGLSGYGGRGPLEGWLRVAATRAALGLRRGERRRDSWERAASLQVLEGDEELQVLKRRYREPLERAFDVAAASLGAAQRALLRLHYAEGVTTAQLAGLHGVSRPTLVRRLTEAREALVAGVEDELRRTVGLGPDELTSVLRLVRSQLELSLATLLRA
jgi:RNA polymerase sigma-70 factor (ECF subfamily)